MTKTTSENDVESHLTSECEKAGFLCYKFVCPGYNGVPDRIVIGNGHTVFVELKAPGEQPRKLQVYRMKEIERRGGHTRVIDTIQKVDDFISELKS